MGVSRDLPFRRPSTTAVLLKSGAGWPISALLAFICTVILGAGAIQVDDETAEFMMKWSRSQDTEMVELCTYRPLRSRPTIPTCHFAMISACSHCQPSQGHVERAFASPAIRSDVPIPWLFVLDDGKNVQEQRSTTARSCHHKQLGVPVGVSSHILRCGSGALCGM